MRYMAQLRPLLTVNLTEWFADWQPLQTELGHGVHCGPRLGISGLRDPLGSMVGETQHNPLPLPYCRAVLLRQA